MNIRAQVHAREAQEIEASQSRAIAAREAESRPRNALEAMANRLQVSPAGLKSTLMQTVFSGCRNDSEFIALVMVANEYHLNPLLKEIYAFPAKGGGIVPMVGYDGWVKLMNNHPQFDGIEYNDHLDSKGNLYAIECIIYRKDRRHPIKLMELLDECRRGTEPWKMMPSRMLRNRVTCQAARLAFGFSGIASEGDEDTFIDGGALAAQSLPPRQSFADQLDDEIPAFDKQTGEVFAKDSSGRSVEDEETARALDAGDPTEAEIAEETARAINGPLPEQDEKPVWLDLVAEIRAGLNAAKTKTYFAELDAKFTNARAGLPDDVITELDKLSAAARKRVANSEV
jgi:phage recombination protein Bet